MINDIFQFLFQPKTVEIDAYGCQIVITKLRDDYFYATVTYQLYNALGVWIATPTWQRDGTGIEVYAWILATVAHAMRHNAPPVNVLAGLLAVEV